MADGVSAARKPVSRTLYGRTTSLNLNSKKLKTVPKCVSKLTNLSVLLMSYNSITDLPAEIISLQHVSARHVFAENFTVSWKTADVALGMFYTSHRCH